MTCTRKYNFQLTEVRCQNSIVQTTPSHAVASISEILDMTCGS